MISPLLTHEVPLVVAGVHAGLLPAPYEIGPNSVAFKSQEIQERDDSLKRKTYGQEAS